MRKRKKNRKITLIPILIILLALVSVISIFIIKIFINTNNKITTKTQKKIEIETPTKVSQDNKKTVIDTNRFSGLTLTNENVGIPVLYYHSVDPSETNEVIISPTKLKSELQYIKDSGYTTLTMDEVYKYLANNQAIPEKSIMITFDDGYMDNYTNAFPILKELNMKATIFVISSGIDDGYYLSSAQIKEMSQYGIDIESHTVNHVHLNQINYDQQLKELIDSKNKLSQLTGKEVLSVAYPYGDYNNDTLRATKDAGYSLAFTTKRGYADRTDNILELNRIYVSSAYSLDTFKTILATTTK